MLRIATVLIFSFFAATTTAQSIALKDPNPTLKGLFDEIESTTEVRFSYSEDDINTKQQLELSQQVYELDALLKEVSTQLGLQFKRIDNNIVVLNKQAQRERRGQELILRSVRGVIQDAATGTTLPSANVLVMEFPEFSGATDVGGNFLLDVPIGRVNLAVSYVGYQTQVIPILLTTGQEPFLTIRLEPSIASLQEFVVESERDRARTTNEMAYASGRSFNIQEANRYAGSLGDPARMTRSYAGVVPARDDRNDIIIRGNSPSGIQWRLDGIEIPNPNHYGGIGMTGNTVTLLNMNLIDDSDFLMGAFPSEYGNALAGVFDLHLKRPNPQRRQYRFQTGWNGFEGGTEGPFSKQRDIGTYSLTYRYSFLDLMANFGVDFGVLPEFQDVTGNFNFNLGKNTTLSFIGIWGKSFIELDDHTLDSTDRVGHTGQHLKTGSDLWLGGLNLNHRFNEQWSMKTGLSIIDNSLTTEIDTFNFESNLNRRVFTDGSGETKYSFFLQTDYRQGRNLLRTGLRWDTYDIRYSSTSVDAVGNPQILHNSLGQLNLARAYVEDEYRFSDRFRGRAGLHSQYFLFNDKFALEPRVALRYLASDYHVIAVAYGNHHMLQPRTVYFVETPTATVSELSNKGLDFSGAHHMTLSYNFSLTEHLRLRAETYYQHLYDIPIESDPNSTFSMVNVGADFFIPQVDSLVNEGIGRNYGIELTFERFLNKGVYYMLNGTLFKSQYQNLDGQWRSTAFDMLYTINLLGGYEYWISQKVALGFDAKLTYAGGRPYIPVDEEASIAANEVILKEDQAFEVRYSEYFRTDVKIYYRINYKHVYTEFAIDLQNLTNHANVFRQEFDTVSGEYKTFYQMAFFPMFTFRCLF